MVSEILGFYVIDNLVIGRNGAYYSYREYGKFSKQYTNEEKIGYANMVAAENAKKGGK
jgi:hypothetical protein